MAKLLDRYECVKFFVLCDAFILCENLYSGLLKSVFVIEVLLKGATYHLNQ